MKKNNTLRNWLALSSFSVAAALALSGCAGDASPTSAPSMKPAGSVDTAAAAALPSRYKDSGLIKVASDYPYPPMEMLDANGKLTGLDYDLAEALGVKLGVKLELQKQAFATNIPALQAGQKDIIMSGMNDTPEREKTLDFVNYFHAGFSILVQKGNPNNINGILDLCGKPVAASNATAQADLLRSYDQQCTAKGPGPIIVTELPGETDVQTAVRAGKAIADVTDSAVAAYSAQTAGDGKIFDVVRDPKNPAGYSPVHTGIGVLKKNSDLSNALLLAMKAVMADGTYVKILNKYDLADYAEAEAGINLGGGK